MFNLLKYVVTGSLFLICTGAALRVGIGSPELWPHVSALLVSVTGLVATVAAYVGARHTPWWGVLVTIVALAFMFLARFVAFESTQSGGKAIVINLFVGVVSAILAVMTVIQLDVEKKERGKKNDH